MIDTARMYRLARANVGVLLDQRRAYTIGWAAAFISFGTLCIVQRAELA